MPSPVEPYLKFNMIFHDSIIFFSFQNIKIKLNSRSCMALRSSVVIFQALKPLRPQWPLQPQQPPRPQFHQTNYCSWWLDTPWQPNHHYWSIFVEWIIKNPNFQWYLYFFCRRLLRSADIIFLKTGWWNSNIQISEFQSHLQTNSSLHISTFQSQYIKYVSIWDTLYYIYRWTEHSILPMPNGGGFLTLKFIYSEKATKFCEILPLLLTVCTAVKS